MRIAPTTDTIATTVAAPGALPAAVQLARAAATACVACRALVTSTPSTGSQLDDACVSMARQTVVTAAAALAA
ncbi:MAG: hypothetical protein ACK4ZJ_16455, partial [Allorhizobium sp.]